MRIFLSFLLLLFLVGCSKEAKKLESPRLSVEVKKIEIKDIPIKISSFGTLEAIKDVNIKSQVPGQITKVFFKEGSYVKKGDILFQMDDTIFKNNLAIDEASLSSDSEEFKYQSYIIERDQKLYQSGSIAKQEYLRLLVDKAETEARIKSDKAKINLDTANLEYCTIRAPIDGKIGYIFVDVGNIIGADSDILANIKDTSSLYVKFNLPEANIFRVEKALKDNNGKLKLFISLDKKDNDNNNDEESFSGSLISVDNSVGNNVSSIILQGTVDNTNNGLLPGMFVDVRVLLGTDKNVILIPSEAIINDNENHYFFIIRNGMAEKLSAKNIHYYDEYCAVVPSKPLNADDEVITTHLLDIVSGEKVLIVSNPNSIK